MPERPQRTARTSRVAEEFREILGEEILKLKDPRVGFVTVTGVRVTPDLRHARVFYTVMGDDAAAHGGRPPRSARRAAHLRRVIGHQVRLKVLPDLEFEEDATIDSANRIEQLIEQAASRRAGAGMNERLDRAATILREATSIALACHVNPDPDALGSMLGLSNHLRSHGEDDALLVPERAVRAAAMGRAPARRPTRSSRRRRSPRSPS